MAEASSTPPRKATPQPVSPTPRWTVTSDIAGLAEALSPKPKPPQSKTRKKKSSAAVAAAAGPPCDCKECRARRKREGESGRKTLRMTRSLFAFLPGERNFEKLHLRAPDWSCVAAERAVRHCYDARRMTWSHSTMRVWLDPHPFAVGGMRRAHFMVACPAEEAEKKGDRATDPAALLLLVAKFANDSSAIECTAEELRTLCSQNVEQQMIAKYYASRFNKYKPPKAVDFLEASMYELLDRQQPADAVCGVEMYTPGHYSKWNNNFGFVAENTRNTPQAFSHFTYEASKHQIIIVDIQGVGDLYTDPVIHTRDRNGSELFAGNMGIAGIEQFLLTHTCNPLCRALNLPLLNASARPSPSLHIQEDAADEGGGGGDGTQFAQPGSPRRVEITRTSVAVYSMGKPPNFSEEAPLLGASQSCCGCSCCIIL